MFVTYDHITKAGACEGGQKWFLKNYPNGVELKELMTRRHLNKAFLHWGYKYLTPNEEEKALYHNILHNENNSDILDCDNTCNSTRIFNSSHIENSKDVHSSKDIKNSNVVINSESVENSGQVFLSEFVYDSNKVLNSNNVNKSVSIIDSTYVVRSHNIYMSNLITGCAEIYKGINLEDCFFCKECSNIKHCFGCYGLKEGEYYIFNKQVSPEHFEIIKKQYLSIMTMILKYVDSWPIDIIYVEIPKINRKFPQHYETIPAKFWKWVKTLPNYSDKHMHYLTFLPEFLTK